MRRAPGGQLFVLNLDELRGETAIGSVPPAALMAEDLDIDALFVERTQARGTEHEPAIELILDVAGEVRVFDEVQFLRHDEVPVHVNHFHSSAADGHLTAFRGRSLKKSGGASARRDRTGRDAGCGFEEVSAIRHD